MPANKRILQLLATILVLSFALAACSSPKETEAGDDPVALGPVTLNPHPTSLEGKTVVLRWNGKPNGDKFLTRVGELLGEQVQDVKIVRMWEVDPSTAVSSDGAELSAEIVDKVAAQQPDLVIAAQCD